MLFFREKGWIVFENLLVGQEFKIIPWSDQKKFGVLAAELFEVQRLRLGMMQAALQAEGTLEELCPVQGIFGGLLLGLSEREGEFLPAKPGNGVFFGKDLVVPFGGDLLLIFAEERAVYRPRKGCPWNEYYRQLGYAPNDRLCEPHHPLLVR